MTWFSFVQHVYTLDKPSTGTLVTKTLESKNFKTFISLINKKTKRQHPKPTSLTLPEISTTIFLLDHITSAVKNKHGNVLAGHIYPMAWQYRSSSYCVGLCWLSIGHWYSTIHDFMFVCTIRVLINVIINARDP